jgi:hypothetical protein
MEEAAEKMGYSYFWLAHNWKELGLHPTNFGHRRLFEEREIEKYISQHRYSYKGRPRKNQVDGKT